MKVTWQKAKPSDYPIIVFRVWKSTLPEQGARPKAKKDKRHLIDEFSVSFLDPEKGPVDVDIETYNTGGFVDFEMRLPYTMTALKNRAQMGKDIPKFIKLTE